MNLKPCPFCGGAAEFVNKAIDDIVVPGVPESSPLGDVQCGTPGCLMESGADRYDEPAEATAKWNKRI